MEIVTDSITSSSRTHSGCEGLVCHRGLLAAPWSFRGIHFLQICKLARANYQASMLQSCFLKVQFSSVTQLCPTLCDPMNRSTPGLPVHHQLPEFTQTHAHGVSDAIKQKPYNSNPSQCLDFL